jgi:hypothetical protein
MSRAAWGVLGGGAATVYLRPDLVQDFVREKALPAWMSSPRDFSTVAGNSREIEQLTKLVRALLPQACSSHPAVPPWEAGLIDTAYCGAFAGGAALQGRAELQAERRDHCARRRQRQVSAAPAPGLRWV